MSKVSRNKTENTDKFFGYGFAPIYAIIIILLFREFIFSKGMLFGSDTIEAGLMFRAFLAGFFKQYHTIPLWNPYLFGGLPFVDAMHGDTFFPLSFIQFIMPIHKALGWKLILTAYFGGIITYFYFRNLGFSRTICFWGGLLYLLNGFTISLVYAGHDGRMYVSVLFPMLLLAIDLIFRKANLLSLFFWSLSFSLLVLANHPQLAYFAMWGVGAYTLFRIVILIKEKAGIRRIVVVASIIGVGIIIGLAGSLVQILPQYVYVNKYSPRAEGGKGYDYASSWSLHPEEAISLINPKFCGVNAGGENDYWGRNGFRLNSEYAGFIPLIFALIALIYIRKRNIYFFAFLGFFAILYALGDHTPIFKLFYYIVPGVKSFRAPSTIMFLYVFSVIYLAVFGIRYISDSIKEKGVKEAVSKLLLIVAIVISAITVLFAISPEGLLKFYNSILYSNITPDKINAQAKAAPSIAGGFWLITVFCWIVYFTFRLYAKKSISFAYLAAVIALLSIVELWYEDAKFIRSVPFESYFRKGSEVSFLQNQKQKSDFRVISFPGTFNNQNYMALYGIEQVFGYHGNELKRYDKFARWNWIRSAATTREYQQRFYNFLYEPRFDLLNAKYLASPFPLNDKKFQAVYNVGKLYINENKYALPRTRVVYNYEIIADTDSAMARVDSDNFDYRNSVILNENPSIPIKKDSLSFTQARMTKNNINYFDIEAEAEKPGLLLIQDNYYPAWKASVDGKPSEILMADGNFMAVPIPAGKHTVHIEFDSPYYNYSSASTKIIWLIYFVAVILFLFKRFRRKE